MSWFSVRRGRWLLLVGAVYVVVQLVLFDPQRFLEWDEAVYLSQVQQGVPAVLFAEHRARGITLLVAPLAAFGAPLVAIRLTLVALSGVLLILCMAPWLRVLHRAAPLAAALFGGNWLALYYGSEIMPNLHVAFGLVAAAGCAAVWLGGERSLGWLAAVAALTAWVALLRPSDAAYAAAGLGIVALAVPRRRLAVPVALAAGLAVGWLPWIVEAFASFGGPVQRLREAAALVEGGEQAMLLGHLRVADGPLVGPDPTGAVSPGAAVWWIGLVVFSVVAFLRADPRTRMLLAVPTAAAVTVIAPYFFTGALAPRFLLPGYALLSVPVAVGLLAAAPASRRRSAAAAPVPSRRSAPSRSPLSKSALTSSVPAVVALVALVAWHVPTALRIAGERAEWRATTEEVGRAFARAVEERPCRFASYGGRPGFQFLSGCHGSSFSPDSSAAPFPDHEVRRYEGRVYVLSAEAPPTDSPVSDWPTRPLPDGWVLYGPP